MLTNYQKAFKAYDSRGTYGSEIDEHFSYTLGKAIGKYFAKTFTAEEKFLITSDARNQNPKLIKAFEIGIHETNPTLQVDYGAFRDTNISTDKYPYGICSTSTAYYLGYQDYALSVTFTASHNPPEDV
jgi:phosphomannomutase